ncbi:USP domain-containing protein [Lachancea thermotolerans]
MNFITRSSSGFYNNGNTSWIEEIFGKHNKQLQYIGIAAATALSLYVLAPSFIGGRNDEMFSSSKRSDKYTTGLINNRNDCFANSSVQAFSSLPKLTMYMNDLLKQVLFMKSLLDRNNNGEENDSEEELDPLQNSEVSNGRSNSLEGSLAPGHLRPSLQGLNPRDNLKGASSTATITTLSTLEGSTDGRGHGAGIDTADASAAQSTCESSCSREAGICSASSNEIPEVPMHEGLAQMMYQLQQLVTSSTYVSVWPFLHVLELIFDAKISSGQNDAHELSQVILETLEKENLRVKKFVKDQPLNVIIPDFPVKGSLADHLICLNCQGSSKVNMHPFTMYSLPVPQEPSASLSAMIADNQTETIDGYSCLSCKIKAILTNEEQRGSKGNSDEEQNILATLSRIISEIFINDDLSDELTNYVNNYKKDGCETSSIKSRIVKKTVVTESPEILILHLSRSVFNGTNYTRNSCYVNFDEELHTQEQTIENNRCVGVKPIKYKLKSMVKHQGTHSQGHYECFRRKPDLVKDSLSGQVVNRSPTIDFGLDSNREAANAWNLSTNHSSSDVSSLSSQNSETSSVPFRTVFPESTPGASASPPVVDDDDYIVGHQDSSASNAPSRKPSKLKKLTGFLSRRSSVASAAPESKPPPSRKNSVSVALSDTAPPGGRSRMNSVVSTNSSAWVSSSGADLTETSTSEQDEPSTVIKRKLKKIKSVSKFPFWKISDTAVREAKEMEVLGQTKYVYMLFYERVDEQPAQ